MAKLGKEVALELKIGEAGQEWIPYELSFEITGQQRVFSAAPEQVIGKFCFAKESMNGVSAFIEQAKNFIEDSSKPSLFFEPAEPSFELEIQRTKHGDELKVYCWVDASNTNKIEYSWDAEGIRFLCSQAELKQFITDLESELPLS